MEHEHRNGAARTHQCQEHACSNEEAGMEREGARNETKQAWKQGEQGQGERDVDLSNVKTRKPVPHLSVCRVKGTCQRVGSRTRAGGWGENSGMNSTRTLLHSTSR